MTDLKKCPACNGEVPILAVRCKFCGVRLDPPIETLAGGTELSPPGEPSMIADLDDFDLDSDLDFDSSNAANERLVSAPPPPVRAPLGGGSVAPPPPKPSAAPTAPVPSAPPPPKPSAAPTAPVPSAPPPPRPSAAPSIRGPEAGHPKQTILGMAPPVQMPPAAAPQTLPDAPLAGLERDAMASSLLSPADPLVGDDDLDALDLDDDLLGDEFEEISKFTEQTAITDVSTLAQGMSDEGDVEDDDLPPDLLEDILDEPELASAEEMSGAALPLPEMPQPLGEGQAPVRQPVDLSTPMQSTHSFAPMPSRQKQGTSPVIYGLIAMIALLAVGGVAFMLLSGEETAESEEAALGSPGEVAVAPAEPPEATAPEEGAANEDGEEAAAPVAAPAHTCTAIADYPEFPWKENLAAVAQGVGKSAICGLFGESKEAIVMALKGKPSVGPTGYDLLPNASVLEVFPLGKAKRRDPTMEYIFVDDTLFEVRLKYQTFSAETLASDMLKPVLGAPERTPKDSVGREVLRYKDGDMSIAWYKKTDAFNRVFNELVFASKIRQEGMTPSLEKRKDALTAFEQGMAFFNQRQSMRAIDKFRQARKLIPSMGIAYIFEGITALQSENFTKTAHVAKEALDNTTDDRARAGAKGLQAVIALYNEDKSAAMELFKAAASLDPADPEFSTSYEELKSGDYDPSRVAKTAARMSCKRDKPDWSTKGLLARGNFPDNATFSDAKNKAKRAKDYKSAFDMWVTWECN